MHQTRAHPLWRGIEEGARFYFAHSFFPVPEDAALTAATADYPTPFTCAIARANIFATQFHPEKSQRAGLSLLANFVAWDGPVAVDGGALPPCASPSAPRTPAARPSAAASPFLARHAC